MVFSIKGFNLVLGVSFELPFLAIFWFPNNKYTPNTKNYLPCFVLGGGFSIRRKGLYMFAYIYTYEYIYIYVFRKCKQGENMGSHGK